MRTRREIGTAVRGLDALATATVASIATSTRRRISCGKQAIRTDVLAMWWITFDRSRAAVRIRRYNMPWQIVARRKGEG